MRKPRDWRMVSLRALGAALVVFACGAGDDDSLYGCGARPGEGTPDGGTAVGVDAAAGVDAAPGTPDATSPLPDAGVVSPDAGTAAPDAGCDGVTCTSEVSCHDGFDDDADSLVDCQDDDCDADPDCERAGEITCNDGIDNDSDGAADCDDPACALVCALPPCPSGQDALGFAATDLPAPIEDMSTTTSAVSVSVVGTVERVAVSMSATHTFDDDLDIDLRSPAGTQRTLSSDNGGNDNDYIDTVFIDSASISVRDGAAPFSGSYRPEESLDAFTGELVAGAWQLRVFDDAFEDSGELTRFELAMCISP